MISITICDDEPGTCSDIENIILNYTHSHAIETVIEIFYSGETLYESMEKGYRTDLLFLDIQLFEMNGVEVGKKIREQLGNEKISIIYISSKETYAILETLEKCIKITEINKGIFYFNIAKTIHKLYFDEIKYFECKGKKIEIHSQNDVIEYYSGMKEVEKQVIGKGFLAIHKSYIVNTMFISAYHYESVKITDGTVLPVSQKYRKKMKSYLLELL